MVDETELVNCCCLVTKNILSLRDSAALSPTMWCCAHTHTHKHHTYHTPHTHTTHFSWCVLQPKVQYLTIHRAIIYKSYRLELFKWQTVMCESLEEVLSEVARDALRLNQRKKRVKTSMPTWRTTAPTGQPWLLRWYVASNQLTTIGCNNPSATAFLVKLSSSFLF